MSQATVDLAKALKCGLFGSRDNIDQAYQYCLDIAKSSDSNAAVITAVHVLMNTIAAKLEESV